MSTVATGPRARFHTFLRRLRAKGRSNMYGAVPYLMRAFGLTREDAFGVVCEWIDAQDAEPAAPPAPTPRPRQRTPRAGRGVRKRRGTKS
jgi:hypothetical protein